MGIDWNHLFTTTDGRIGRRTYWIGIAALLVLQALSYEQPGAYRAEQALDDLQLVHEGPVQGLQQQVLADAGVWPREPRP